jgi:hypothetical protein
MADDSNGRLPALNLSTTIVIVTMLAGLAGTWSVMGERIQNLTTSQSIERAAISALDARMDAAEREAARAEIRLETLREDVTELQSRRR